MTTTNRILSVGALTRHGALGVRARMHVHDDTAHTTSTSTNASLTECGVEELPRTTTSYRTLGIR